MRRTRSAASAAGIPAAVTNSGRAEDPRMTSTAWVAVRNRDLATPITGMPDPACANAPRPGRTAGPGRRSRGHQQAQASQTIQDRAQRRELAQAELARPIGLDPRDHHGTFGQQARESGISGQDDCRPRATGPQAMHIYGRAHAEVRTLTSLHVC